MLRLREREREEEEEEVGQTCSERESGYIVDQ
jgi:hypothetical protein